MAETYNTPEEMAAAAKRGDADAQYRLASLLIQSEENAEHGIEWLRKSAAAGHANARYTLALFTLKGRHMDPQPARAYNLLETIAEKGHPPARMLLAVLTAAGVGGREGDWDAAIDLTLRTAEKGDPGALRDLGLLARMAGRSDDLVHDCLFAAGTRGDLMACAALIARYGDGDTRLDGGIAKVWAQGLVHVGHPLAQTWEKAIEAEATTEAPELGAVPTLSDEDKDAIRNIIREDVNFMSVSDRPRLRMRPDFISREMAAHLIGFAAPYLKEQGGVYRAVMGLSEMDMSMVALALKTMRAADKPMTVEPLVIEAIPPGLSGPALSPETGEIVDISSYLALSDTQEGGGLAFGSGGKVEAGEPGTMYLLNHRLDDNAVDGEAFVEHVATKRTPRWHLVQLMLPTKK